MDEIKLFEELQPPPSPDVPRMRAAARARLTAATSVPLVHPAARRRTVVAVTAAAAMAAGGTGYGLTLAQGGSSGTSSLPATVAGLTAVHGCPGTYIAAGTLQKVSGRRATIQAGASNKRVTVATSAETAITRPVSGTVSDITDGSHVVVQGTWSGRRLAAREVGIEAALPRPRLPFPRHPRHLRKVRPPKGALRPPVAIGAVVDAHDGSFTVVMGFLFRDQRVQVITSNSTKVLTDASASLHQLKPGANVVAVGRIRQDGVLTASTVTEPAAVRIMIGGGLVRLRPSSCSASAITTAAILAGG